MSDAYGAVANSASVSDPFGFEGQAGYYADQSTGLILTTLRYYDPGYGRFLNRDPSGYHGGINVYNYCQNNPENNLDPAGLGDFDNILNAPPIHLNGFWTPGIGAPAPPGANCGSSGNPWLTGLIIGVAVVAVIGIAIVAPEVLPILAEGAAEGLASEGAETGAVELGEGAAEGFGEEGGEVCQGGTGCFVAGTQVQMADGSTRSIDKIKVGDEVKSRDPATGKDQCEPVLRLYVHPGPQIIELHLSDGEVITCTPEHRFYVPGKGFEEAGKLTTGDELSEGDEPIVAGAKPALSTVKVDSIVWDAKATTPSTATTVYNFEVANTHTYFVGKELGGVWVHNDCTNEAARIIREQGGEVWNVNNGGARFWLNGTRNFYHDVVMTPDGSINDTLTYGGDETAVSLEQWQTDWEGQWGGDGSQFGLRWNFGPGSGNPLRFSTLMGGP